MGYPPQGSGDIDWIRNQLNGLCHSLVPETDDTYDLGSSTKEFKNLYVDGVAHVDDLYVDGSRNLHLARSTTFSYNPPSIPAGGVHTVVDDVEPAALTDLVLISGHINMQGIILTGYVSAAGKVTLVFFNPTGAAVDLPQVNCRIFLIRTIS